jgi:hypothetical protein
MKYLEVMHKVSIRRHCSNPRRTRQLWRRQHHQSRMDLLSRRQSTRYLCASCGFIEEWIDAAADVAKVKTKYAS